MEVKVNGKVVLALEEWKEKVIQHDIPTEIFQEDMERRVRWVVEHHFERCFNKFYNECLRVVVPERNIKEVPLDWKQFSELMFEHLSIVPFDEPISIHVNDKEVFSLEGWQQSIIQMVDGANRMGIIPKTEALAGWVLRHKFECCYERMHRQWKQKFEREGEIQSIPVDPYEFTLLAFTHPHYRNRSQRETEANI